MLKENLVVISCKLRNTRQDSIIWIYLYTFESMFEQIITINPYASILQNKHKVTTEGWHEKKETNRQKITSKRDRGISFCRVRAINNAAYIGNANMIYSDVFFSAAIFTKVFFLLSYIYLRKTTTVHTLNSA